MIYGITTYKLQGDSLKPISYEYQDYQNEKRNYIKKFENLITGETKSEELNYDWYRAVSISSLIRHAWVNRIVFFYNN